MAESGRMNRWRLAVFTQSRLLAARKGQAPGPARWPWPPPARQANSQADRQTAMQAARQAARQLGSQGAGQPGSQEARQFKPYFKRG